MPGPIVGTGRHPPPSCLPLPGHQQERQEAACRWQVDKNCKKCRNGEGAVVGSAGVPRSRFGSAHPWTSNIINNLTSCAHLRVHLSAGQGPAWLLPGFVSNTSQQCFRVICKVAWDDSSEINGHWRARCKKGGFFMSHDLFVIRTAPRMGFFQACLANRRGPRLERGGSPAHACRRMCVVSHAQGLTQGYLVELQKPFPPRTLFEKAIGGCAIFPPVPYQPPKHFRVFL